jgi:hypothetical protein
VEARLAVSESATEPVGLAARARGAHEAAPKKTVPPPPAGDEAGADEADPTEVCRAVNSLQGVQACRDAGQIGQDRRKVRRRWRWRCRRAANATEEPRLLLHGLRQEGMVVQLLKLLLLQLVHRRRCRRAHRGQQ